LAFEFFAYLKKNGHIRSSILRMTHLIISNRNINIIVKITYVESTAASASALLNIWSFSISIAVRLRKITGNAKPRVYYC
jgi:hypothetical protein